MSYADGRLVLDVECAAAPASHCEALAAITAFANAVRDLETRIGPARIVVRTAGLEVDVEAATRGP